MTFRGDFQKSGNRASAGGGGGKIAVGGGIGTLLIAGVILLMGGSPTDVMNALGGGSQQQELPSGSGKDGSGGLDHCKTGEDANKYADCRVEFTAISVDRVWEQQLPKQANIQYTKPGINVFSGS